MARTALPLPASQGCEVVRGLEVVRPSLRFRVRRANRKVTALPGHLRSRPEGRLGSAHRGAFPALSPTPPPSGAPVSSSPCSALPPGATFLSELSGEPRAVSALPSVCVAACLVQDRLSHLLSPLDVAVEAPVSSQAPGRQSGEGTALRGPRSCDSNLVSRRWEHGWVGPSLTCPLSASPLPSPLWEPSASSGPRATK